ncbi:phosphotransferase [Sporolactobacillus sp. CPB3-1]|uniref:Phosphotransferase n=1 Tax=Sporolactobacillus mangiferae TaxID=2940498 RepID=A0ABT0MD80_9BACL|nr:phosphotransferase [Sporolactobacillus mangiferae]MCL1632834.1 phosphotransferase [Sporolactobacillus mangiferae]
MSTQFQEIPGSEHWTSVKAIYKGWSDDQKYRITTQYQSYLLRISAGSRFNERKKEFEMLQKLQGIGASPVAFGTCGKGKNCYTLMTWIDGEEASKVLPALSAAEQYRLGYEAGQIMKKIHTIPAPESQQPWLPFYQQKIDRKLLAYQKCAMSVEGAAETIAFIQSQRGLLTERPQSLQHGDFHCGNMIVTKKKTIGIIDFDRIDFGDPWEEFNRITWCANVSPAFATGRINGYFNDHIPNGFFPCMALYIATNMISSIPWSIDYGEQQINVMKREIKQTLDAYHYFHTLIPRWYQPPEQLLK